MEINAAKIKEIMNTLPIGYYLGRAIPIELSEDSQGSYFNSMDDKIIISYPMINDILTHYELTNEEDIESTIRCLLYHEISHAVLTPKEMKVNRILNCFEDERIETILKHYYRKVNFKEFCKKVNHYEETKDTPITDAHGLFYKIVRFREGPKEFVDRVQELINKYKYLNATSTSFYSYTYDVNKLFNDILEYYKIHLDDYSKDTPEETSSDKSSKEIVGKTDETSDSSKTGITKSSDDEDEFDEKEFEEIKEIITTTVKKMSESFLNKKFDQGIHDIIYKNTGRMRNGGSAVNTYSGKLDARSTQRKDYKWFTKPNSSGSMNVYDKIKLNVFCDVSGSFRGSEHKINELLYSLIKLEKENKKFTFDLIEMGQNRLLGNNRIAPKNKRSVECCEGNALTHEIFDCYKKVQDKNKTVINLVVFDGNALSFDSESNQYIKREKNKSNFAAFNHSNTIIISDYSNESYITEYSPNSKNIFTCNYIAELESNILKSLDSIIR